MVVTVGGFPMSTEARTVLFISLFTSDFIFQSGFATKKKKTPGNL